MFPDLAGIAKLMKNASQLAGQAGEMKQRLAGTRVWGDCEGIRVEATGDHKIVRIEIDDAVHASLDRESLEARLLEACNVALIRAREAVAREMSGVAAGLGVPGLGEAMAKFGIGQ